MAESTVEVAKPREQITLVVAPTLPVARALALREFWKAPASFRWWLVTPRTRDRARGRIADQLLVAPEMVSDERLPALLLEIAPCFATSRSPEPGSRPR